MNMEDETARAATQVFPSIYRIAVPLPGSPLKELGCYVIRGGAGERSLMIDTGFHHEACERAVRTGLQALDLRMEDVDIFLTHLHADHSGLCDSLKTAQTRVFIRDCDGARVNGFLTTTYWDALMALQPLMGVPASDLLDYHNHPAYVNRVAAPVTFTDAFDGMRFNVGGYALEAVDLAGHTPGQLGLWDRERGILFSGDHILAKITPNICLWDFENDYLEIYLRNLRKVQTMQIKTLFTAHRQIITDVDTRITEMFAHHARRCDEICTLLRQHGSMTVWALAHEMHWDFGVGKFGEFPPNQKWFGALEVFAHTEHLRRIQRIELAKKDEAYIYSALD